MIKVPTLLDCREIIETVFTKVRHVHTSVFSKDTKQTRASGA